MLAGSICCRKYRKGGVRGPEHRDGRRVTNLNGVVRVSFVEEAAFEQGLETGKELSHADIGGRPSQAKTTARAKALW